VQILQRAQLVPVDARRVFEVVAGNDALFRALLLLFPDLHLSLFLEGILDEFLELRRTQPLSLQLSPDRIHRRGVHVLRRLATGGQESEMLDETGNLLLFEALLGQKLPQTFVLSGRQQGIDLVL